MDAPPQNHRLDGLFEAYDRADAPGLVVGVAQRGEVVYRRGFGMASLEHGTPNTPLTRMRIGSTTKHFTCLGILLLEQQGKLDIQQPVRTWLPELGLHGEPSLLQLMHHSGGLCDSSMAVFLANGGYFGHMPPGTTLQILRKLNSRNFAPGTRMAYSNDGYTLLSLVIERVSGLACGDFMTRFLFEPLGLSATALVRSDLDIVPGLATLHIEKPEGGWRRGIYFSDELLGSGGIASSVDDMLAWAAHLRSGRKNIGSEATWNHMLQGQTFRDGARLGYGLGLMREMWRGIDIIHHAGATLGSQCQMLIAPAHELDIVVMANRMDAPAPALALNVMEVLLQDAGLGPELEPAAAADHPALPGRWFSRQSRTLLSIDAKPPKPGQREVLTISLYNGAAVAAVQSASGLARAQGPFSPVEIRQPPEGQDAPSALEVHICGDAEHFERLPMPPPSVEDLAPTLCGRYRYADPGKEVEIRLQDGRLVLDLLPLSGLAQWPLEPFADDVLGCGNFISIPPFPLPLQATLSLERKDGKVLGFWFDTDRARNLRFDRCGNP